MLHTLTCKVIYLQVYQMSRLIFKTIDLHNFTCNGMNQEISSLIFLKAIFCLLHTLAHFFGKVHGAQALDIAGCRDGSAKEYRNKETSVPGG